MKLTTDQQNYQRRLLAIDRDLNTYQTQLMSPGPDFEPARRRLLITDEQMAADQAAVRRDGELRCLIIGSADQVSELDAQVAEGEKIVAEAMLTLRNARELLAGISARRRDITQNKIARMRLHSEYPRVFGDLSSQLKRRELLETY